jgi:tetratricopeptide (TPR) repeat protein
MRFLSMAVMAACLVAPCCALAEYPELTALKQLGVQSLEVYAKRLSAVDGKFEGVIQFGKRLGNLPKPEEINIAEITYQSKDYWRAVLEMDPSDPSVLFAHAYLHLAKGEIAYADTYFVLGGINMDSRFKAEAAAYQKLRAALDQRLQAELGKGTAAHDKGMKALAEKGSPAAGKDEFEKALKIYDEVLVQHPNCAWAWYEKAYTYLVMGKGSPEFEKQRIEALTQARTRDPFYAEAYQGSDPTVLKNFFVLGKKVLPFARGKNRNADGLNAFAEGCEEMGLFPFAAQARWRLVALEAKNIAPHLNAFLGLLEKCGCKDVDFFRKQFKPEVH